MVRSIRSAGAEMSASDSRVVAARVGVYAIELGCSEQDANAAMIHAQDILDSDGNVFAAIRCGNRRAEYLRSRSNNHPKSAA